MGDATSNMDTALLQLENARGRLRSWMQLRAGDHVLNVGCGDAGTQGLALANLVGPRGGVQAVDFDPLRVEAFAGVARGMGVSAWVRQQCCDPARRLPFESCIFSSSASARFLDLVPDPHFLLAEMARVTAPGGWVAVLDTDWCTLSIDMPDHELERRMVRVKTERCGRNGYAARQMYRTFRNLGLSEVLIELFPIFFTSAASARRLLGFESLEKHARETGLDDGDLARWRSAVDQADRSGTFFASVCLELVAGRRPGTETELSRPLPPDPPDGAWPLPA